MRRVLFALVLFVSPALLHAQTSQDNSVYAAVLDSIYSNVDQPRVVVLARTKARIDKLHLVPEYWTDLARTPGLDKSTMQSFESANRVPKSIAGLKPAHVEVLIVDAEALVKLKARDGEDAISAREYWQRFYSQFPGTLGSVSFTRVGYSKDGMQALVVISNGCGALCGEERNVLLRKVDGKWRVVLMITTMVS